MKVCKILSDNITQSKKHGQVFEKWLRNNCISLDD